MTVTEGRDAPSFTRAARNTTASRRRERVPTYTVTLVLREDELTRLDAAADEVGISRAEAMRRAAGDWVSAIEARRTAQTK